MIPPGPHATTCWRARRCRISYALLLLALLLLNAGFKALAADALRYQGGVRNSAGPQRLNAKQLDQLLKSLREKTGFLELSFNEQGFLALGDATKFVGGSATARALIAAAVKIKYAVDFESHNSSPVVAFARLDQSSFYYSLASARQIGVYPLQIDFTDFSYLRGDRRVLAAFDLGFVVLHELGHAVLGLRDTWEETDSPGECEEYVNRIRRELNLPERQQYIAHTFNATVTGDYKIVRQAELNFTRAIEQQGRVKIEKFNLNWEADRVGPSKHLVLKPQPVKAQTAAAP